MTSTQKAMSDLGAVTVWSLNPEMFTKVDFEPVQQSSDLVLQITEQEEQSVGLKCSRVTLLPDLNLDHIISHNQGR